LLRHPTNEMKPSCILVCLLAVWPSAHAVTLRNRGAASLAGESDNPLLDPSELARFADVDVAKHAKPAVESSLAEGREQAQELEAVLKDKLAQKKDITFNDVAVPLQRLGEVSGRPWSRLNHMNSVGGTDELRKAIAELEPQVVAFGQELGQSKTVYEAFAQIQKRPDFSKLSEARQRIVNNEIRDRKLSGVALSEKDATEFNALSQRLSELSTEFSNHALDATAKWNMTIHDKEKLRGVPPRVLELAAAKAKTGGISNATAEAGPWVLGLDGPMLGPLVTYAEDRSLRETLFRASMTKASSGKEDNTPTINEILEKRQRSAELLGYESYADVSFASKMATRKEVHGLMDQLLGVSRGAAEKDRDELLAFAKKTDNLTSLSKWDNGFYIERLKKEKFDIDSEAIREYFAMPAVLDSLFSLSHRLFGTSVVEVPSAEAKALVWDKEVRLFKLSRDGQLSGYLFFDTYSRPGQKRAGAWVQPMVSKRKDGDVSQMPVAAIVCNFPAPQGGDPALLAFGEVETLFHEFGHALQHILTVQEESAVSGLNGVEWDAVEIASQFMEYWVTEDKATLYTFAKHHKTGEALPEATYKNLKESMNFRKGSMILGQIYMGSIDLRLHEKFEKGEDVFAINMELGTKILIEPPLKEDRFLCAFSHIFAGGYAAGYYSYQWSNVLSADAFSAFEEHHGLSNETQLQATGKRFAATLLAEGGGRAPALVFKDFRGRGPSTAALLKYSGLANASAAEAFF